MFLFSLSSLHLLSVFICFISNSLLSQWLFLLFQLFPFFFPFFVYPSRLRIFSASSPTLLRHLVIFSIRLAFPSVLHNFQRLLSPSSAYHSFNSSFSVHYSLPLLWPHLVPCLLIFTLTLIFFSLFLLISCQYDILRNMSGCLLTCFASSYFLYFISIWVLVA